MRRPRLRRVPGNVTAPTCTADTRAVSVVQAAVRVVWLNTVSLGAILAAAQAGVELIGSARFLVGAAVWLMGVSLLLGLPAPIARAWWSLSRPNRSAGLTYLAEAIAATSTGIGVLLAIAGYQSTLTP